MKYGRRASDHINHERWLVSYADFITLLFAFFVVLYASAQMDQKKAARLAVAIESGFQQMGALDASAAPAGSLKDKAAASGNPLHDAPVGFARTATDVAGLEESLHKQEDFSAIRSELQKALAPEINRHEVALRLQPDGLVVSLREIGFFDSGSATLKSGAEAAFARIVRVLQEHSCAVRVEGHTDTVPIHTAAFASNWELSTARATQVVRVLIETYGFPPDRLSAAGYAEFHPVADNSDTEGRQLNRRVDVVIVNADINPLSVATQPAAPPQAGR